MSTRQVTNILLAIIAGVLLFGRDAVLGGVQVFGWVCLAIGLIYLVLWAITAFAEEVLEGWRQSPGLFERALIVFGLAFLCILVPLFVYVAYLWVEGVPEPLAVAMDSLPGIIWSYVFLTGVALLAAIGAATGLHRMATSEAGIGAYVIVALTWVATIIAAPLLFPIREWRSQTASGVGIAMRLLSSVYAGMLGLTVFLISLGISVTIGLIISSALFK